MERQKQSNVSSFFMVIITAVVLAAVASGFGRMPANAALPDSGTAAVADVATSPEMELAGDEELVPVRASPIFSTRKQCREALRGEGCPSECSGCGQNAFTSCCEADTGWIMCNERECSCPPACRRMHSEKPEYKLPEETLVPVVNGPCGVDADCGNCTCRNERKCCFVCENADCSKKRRVCHNVCVSCGSPCEAPPRP